MRLLLLLGVVIGVVSRAEAQTVAPEPGLAAHVQFRSFYQNPNLDRVPGLVAELDRIGNGDWTTHPPIAGFLAGLLTNPSTSADLLPPRASQTLRADLALAFSLAGQPDRGLALAKKSRMSENAITLIRSTPPLRTLTVRNATELDYLWGAAFATGDSRYIRPIVKRFVQLAADPGVADDILAASIFMRSGKGDLRTMKERHDAISLAKIALGSAILGALARNAAEHEFIRRTVASELPGGTQAHRIFSAFSGRRS